MVQKKVVFLNEHGTSVFLEKAGIVIHGGSLQRLLSESFKVSLFLQ